MFYDYLKKGGYIRIESDNKHNIGYTATVFYMGNVAVYAYNKELGDFPHEKICMQLPLSLNTYVPSKPISLPNDS